MPSLRSGYDQDGGEATKGWEAAPGHDHNHHDTGDGDTGACCHRPLKGTRYFSLLSCPRLLLRPGAVSRFAEDIELVEVVLGDGRSPCFIGGANGMLTMRMHRYRTLHATMSMLGFFVGPFRSGSHARGGCGLSAGWGPPSAAPAATTATSATSSTSATALSREGTTATVGPRILDARDQRHDAIDDLGAVRLGGRAIGLLVAHPEAVEAAQLSLERCHDRHRHFLIECVGNRSQLIERGTLVRTPDEMGSGDCARIIEAVDAQRFIAVVELSLIRALIGHHPISAV